MPRTRGTRHGNGGSGVGWGGEAKGAGSGPAQPFTIDTPTRTDFRGSGDPSKARTRADKKATRDSRVEQLEELLFDLASSNEQPGNVRVTAAARLHAIYEGQPVARVINHNVDDVGQLSDADLRNELARLGGTPADAPAGDEAAGVSGEPGGVVH